MSETAGAAYALIGLIVGAAIALTGIWMGSR